MTVYRIMLAAITAITAVALVAVAPEARGGGGVAITSCAQVVTANAVLTEDLYCAGSDGVVVGAAGITIDLKGFTLRGDNTIPTMGINDASGFSRLTVKNGVVRDFYNGIYACCAQADTVSLSNLVIAGNSIDGVIISGDSVSVKASTISRNGGAGIQVVGDAAKIQSTTVTANNIFGIALFGDSHKILSATVAGQSGQGISIGGASALVKSSMVTGNGTVGIHVVGDHAKITGNRVEANGFEGGASDLAGPGINVQLFGIPPIGKNIARGNDDPTECDPAPLC